ncbi:MAG: DinB family protein [Chloroflexota bacterium]
MTTATQLLTAQLGEAYAVVHDRVQGLTDEEFFWEPVADCWTVRPQANGLWMVDYPDEHPVPGPFTTIAWRLDHLAECKVMYHEYAFGPGRLTWPEIDSAHTVADAIAMLERGQQLLVSALDGLTDADLDAPVRTNWGEEWPAWKIFWTMIDHDLHHGGEIGVLRDLYRERNMSPTRVPASGAPA